MLRRCIVALALFAAHASAGAQGVLLDPGFETGMVQYGTPGYPVTIHGAGSWAHSSAYAWDLYNNTDAVTSSKLVYPTTDTIHPLGSLMIHVQSNDERNGLFQFFNGTALMKASIDVLVVSGSVHFAMYSNHGLHELTSVTNTTNGVWETLTLPKTWKAARQGLINEIILYSGPGGADFYADNASGNPAQNGPPSVPEPAALGWIAGVAVPSLALLLRRRT